MASKGDLNDVLVANDKWGGTPINRRRATNIWSQINYCELMDLGFKGCKFTWLNHRKNISDRIMERLDKIFANEKWVKLFPKASTIHLPKTHSDHNPILINLIPKVGNSLHKPFRLESYWSGHPEFRNIVEECWHNNSFIDASNIFKHHITDWNKNTFGDLFKKEKENFGQT